MDKIELIAQLETEKEHSAFIERLLKTLYGPGWNELTIHEAKKWRERCLSNKATCCVHCGGIEGEGEAGRCPLCGGP